MSNGENRPDSQPVTKKPEVEVVVNYLCLGDWVGPTDDEAADQQALKTAHYIPIPATVGHNHPTPPESVWCHEHQRTAMFKEMTPVASKSV